MRRRHTRNSHASARTRWQRRARPSPMARERRRSWRPIFPQPPSPGTTRTPSSPTPTRPSQTCGPRSRTSQPRGTTSSASTRRPRWTLSPRSSLSMRRSSHCGRRGRRPPRRFSRCWAPSRAACSARFSWRTPSATWIPPPARARASSRPWASSRAGAPPAVARLCTAAARPACARTPRRRWRSSRCRTRCTSSAPATSSPPSRTCTPSSATSRRRWTTRRCRPAESSTSSCRRRRPASRITRRRRRPPSGRGPQLLRRSQA
mmetsp:Transcript_29692/g.85408  ORF Transcript_29692/g.85408 Transcript_29692/m.85408 type:complete len:262 (+) Transcript_29692:183-968(+)